MFPDMEDAEINSRLVGYCSDQVTLIMTMVIIMIYDQNLIIFRNLLESFPNLTTFRNS